MKTPMSRIKRRERRIGNQKPIKGMIMRFIRRSSRAIFGRNLFAWLTDSKKQPKGTAPNKSYNEI